MLGGGILRLLIQPVQLYPAEEGHARGRQPDRVLSAKCTFQAHCAAFCLELLIIIAMIVITTMHTLNSSETDAAYRT